MWHVRLYFEHCRLTGFFLFEYRKDFQKMQALINWRNSLLIKERYGQYNYKIVYTVVPQLCQSLSMRRYHRKCQVHIAVIELFLL